DFAAKVAFDLVVLVDVFTNFQDFGFCELIDALGRLNAGTRTNFQGVRRANAENVAQCNMCWLGSRNVDACNTSHETLPFVQKSRAKNETSPRRYRMMHRGLPFSLSPLGARKHPGPKWVWGGAV